jgi:hypothetical protein
MPMLWGPKQIGDFTQLVKPGYAKTVLGFNEYARHSSNHLFFFDHFFFRPNQSGQSNLDPGYAAQLWQQYIQPLKNQGYALVTPACTNAPSGKQWYQSFFSACTGCTVSGFTLLFGLLTNICFPSLILSLFTIMVLRPKISSTTLPTFTTLSTLTSSSLSLLARFVALDASLHDFFDKN